MNEDTQKTEDGTHTEPKAVEEPGANSTPNKTEDNKKFTQEDVNNIVEGRLAKQKEKYQDYDAIKVELGELREVKTKYVELEKSSQTNLDILNEVYTGLTADLDDEKKNLIPEELPLTEKIRYINKNRKTFQIQQVIKTPLPEDAPKGEAGLFGGKYKTLQEYATSDPKGYLEWRRTQK